MVDTWQGNRLFPSYLGGACYDMVCDTVRSNGARRKAAECRETATTRSTTTHLTTPSYRRLLIGQINIGSQNVNVKNIGPLVPVGETVGDRVMFYLVLSSWR